MSKTILKATIADFLFVIAAILIFVFFFLNRIILQLVNANTLIEQHSAALQSATYLTIQETIKELNGLQPIYHSILWMLFFFGLVCVFLYTLITYRSWHTLVQGDASKWTLAVRLLVLCLVTYGLLWLLILLIIPVYAWRGVLLLPAIFDVVLLGTLAVIFYVGGYAFLHALSSLGKKKLKFTRLSVSISRYSISYVALLIGIILVAFAHSWWAFAGLIIFFNILKYFTYSR